MTITLGDFVRLHRERLGLNQTELAERADVPRETINRLEKNKTLLPMADTRRSIAAAIGVSHLDMLIAAGEIAPEEVVQVSGVVERDDHSPTEQLVATLRDLQLSDKATTVVRDLLEVLAESERIQKRGHSVSRALPVADHEATSPHHAHT